MIYDFCQELNDYKYGYAIRTLSTSSITDKYQYLSHLFKNIVSDFTLPFYQSHLQPYTSMLRYAFHSTQFLYDKMPRVIFPRCGGCGRAAYGRRRKICGKCAKVFHKKCINRSLHNIHDNPSTWLCSSCCTQSGDRSNSPDLGTNVERL